MRQWLHHPATGGYFHCPTAAVKAWQDLGWEPVADGPQETNPAVAENLAWRAAQVAQAQQETKSTKAARRGETQEG